ncbi:MAG: hypothetical protein OEU92_25845 [Alphaproteobacteria bacterium]|nr:hypothetical protein [Alphaproteobacteria bacterium]
MQLTLRFVTPPEAAIWQRLTDEQRQTVIDQLAYLVAKSAIEAARREASDD